MKRKIVLASKSPRRKQLLAQLGLKFEIRESGYEEDMRAKKNPRELAKFLALKKAEDVARYYKDAIIISADTFIVFEDKFIGKPKNKKDAMQILKMFSGKWNTVVTGFALIDTKSKKIINGYATGGNKFIKLNDKIIKQYIATGEPMDKAGAYNANEKGGSLIEAYTGDYFAMVGLPLNKIYLALKKLGVDCLD